MMTLDLNRIIGIHGVNITQIFMNRILILGSTGMLGTMVSRYFLNLKDYDVALTTRAPGQESDESYIFKYDASNDELDSLIQKVNPDYVMFQINNS